MKKLKRVQKLNKKIEDCKLCKGLNKKGVSENAPGFGNINSKVMIVGQSLCTICMASQIPFTGGSGKLLDRVFKVLGIQKSDIFITNTLHCHPPENRPSKLHELANCYKYLRKEIDIVRPRLVIPLGNEARNTFGGEFGKSLVRFVKERGYVIHAMYHPAYLYRMGDTSKTKEYVRQMAKVIRKWL